MLDPFCGSGPTLVAAKRLGRECWGIDSSQEYIDLANRRLEGIAPDAHPEQIGLL